MKVNYYTDMFYNDGNGMLGRNLYLSWRKAGIEVAYKGNSGKLFGLDSNSIDKNLNGNIDVINRQIYSSLEFNTPLKKKIGCFTWEVFYIPQDWVHLINQNLDYFVCFTSHQKEGLKLSGVDENKLVRIPASINVEELYPVEKEKSDCFVFLLNGVHGPRKNYELACECFRDLFSGKKDIKLIAYSHHIWYNEFMKLKEKYKSEKNMEFHWAEVSNYENLRKRYSEADCLLHPTKTEGFGFTPYEALLCGLKVITTCDGPKFGNADFPYKEYLKDFILPLKYSIEEIKWKHSIWVIDGIWAKIDENTLKEQMINALFSKSPDLNKVRNYMRQNFSFEVIGEKWLSLFRKLE